MCRTTHCANIFDNFYITDDGKFLSLMYLHKRVNSMQNEYAIRIKQTFVWNGKRLLGGKRIWKAADDDDEWWKLMQWIRFTKWCKLLTLPSKLHSLFILFLCLPSRNKALCARMWASLSEIESVQRFEREETWLSKVLQMQLRRRRHRCKPNWLSESIEWSVRERVADTNLHYIS